MLPLQPLMQLFVSLISYCDNAVLILWFGVETQNLDIGSRNQLPSNSGLMLNMYAAS